MKLFDSLIHISVTGKSTFTKSDRKCDVSWIEKEMKENQISKACAVGLLSKDYSHEIFLKEVKKSSLLLPIVPVSEKDIGCFDVFVKMGAKGIKIHPRSMGVFSEKIFFKMVEEASSHDLPILFCTYPIFSNMNFIDSIAESCKKSPSARMILMHGGCSQLLVFSELVRTFPNLLLDLSFTFLKYQETSLALDINFLLKKFDRRICFGSDYPDFSLEEFSSSLDLISKDIDNNKRENFYYKNLESFFKL